MIGNDVIDLKLAFQNENWKKKRFLDKLFSNNEKSLLLDSKNLQFMIWLFWSMKEAAYKANQRIFNLPRRFNPTFFECEIREIFENKSVGIVRAGDRKYYCESFFDSEKIHSVATASEVIHPEFATYDAASEIMKTEFHKRFSEVKKIDLKNLNIQYNQHSIPQLFLKSEKISETFSFSHHGRFSAFAYGR